MRTRPQRWRVEPAVVASSLQFDVWSTHEVQKRLGSRSFMNFIPKQALPGPVGKRADYS
jgi:hypothetical protein